MKNTLYKVLEILEMCALPAVLSVIYTSAKKWKEKKT